MNILSFFSNPYINLCIQKSLLINWLGKKNTTIDSCDGLKEKCPPSSWAFEHLVPSWRHSLGRYQWYYLAGGNTSLGAGFDDKVSGHFQFFLAFWLHTVPACYHAFIVMDSSLWNHEPKETLPSVSYLGHDATSTHHHAQFLYLGSTWNSDCRVCKASTLLTKQPSHPCLWYFLLLLKSKK